MRLLEQDEVDWDHCWKPKIFFFNKSGELAREMERFTVLPDLYDKLGHPYAAYHTLVHGNFQQSFDLRAFPFDEQAFTVKVGTHRTCKEVTLKPNPVAASRCTAKDDWTLNESWDMTFSGVQQLSSVSGNQGTRPRIGSRVVARRKPEFYIYNVMALNFLIVLLGLIVFGLEPSDAHVADRIQIIQTAVLTAVAEALRATARRRGREDG